MTSPDGITWTASSAPGTIYWATITYGNDMFVVVANGGTQRVMTGESN